MTLISCYTDLLTWSREPHSLTPNTEWINLCPQLVTLTPINYWRTRHFTKGWLLPHSSLTPHTLTHTFQLIIRNNLLQNLQFLIYISFLLNTEHNTNEFSLLLVQPPTDWRHSITFNYLMNYILYPDKTARRVLFDPNMSPFLWWSMRMSIAITDIYYHIVQYSKKTSLTESLSSRQVWSPVPSSV